MADSPVLTGIETYVDEKRLPLIARTIFGAKTAKHMQLMNGVKNPTALNILGTNVAFNKNVCSWNPSSSAELSQRVLTPGHISVNMNFCPQTLLDKWAAHEFKIAAGRETCPFEEDLLQGLANGIASEIETEIWGGDTASGSQFDGLLKILGDAEGVIGVTFSEGQGAYDKIKAVYAAMPAEIVMKEDTAIFVGDEVYAAFIQELVAANLYHYDAKNGDGEYKLPGTNVSVIAVPGLIGTDSIVGARESNLFYGVDGENGAETLDMWYSKDNREFRFAAAFSAGVQVAFPNEVVLGE